MLAFATLQRTGPPAERPSAGAYMGGGGGGVLAPARLAPALGLSEVKAVREVKVATLWAGYGSISEVTVTAGGKDRDGTLTPPPPLILKRVSPPRGGAGVSHERKVKSYHVEAAFYNECAPALISAGLHVPTPFAIAVSDGGGGGGQLEFLLSDLRASHPRRFYRGGFEDSVAALTLLAGMHARYWEAPLPGGVWEEGSYWRLDTRLEELAATAATGDVRVVRSARALDLRLRGITGRGGAACEAGTSGRPDGAGKMGTAAGEAGKAGGAAGGAGKSAGRRMARRTLIHGDPKGDNLLLSEPNIGGNGPSGITAAAYDLQYCGGGLGVRDVAYFLASSVDAKVLGTREAELVAAYHAALMAGLAVRGIHRGTGTIEGVGGGASGVYPLEELRDDLDVAVTDYARFMAGWGFWGNAAWAAAAATRCLDRIDGGQILASEEEYIDAIARAYPFPE